MGRPREVLSEGDCKVYRSVRAIAAACVFFGLIVILAGLPILTGNALEVDKGLPLWFGAFIVACGVCGVIGGIGIFSGRPRLARLAYGWAVLYVWMFPVGTILSVYLWSKLPQYLRILGTLKAEEPVPT